jgi:hypothetical protein
LTLRFLQLEAFAQLPHKANLELHFPNEHSYMPLFNSAELNHKKCLGVVANLQAENRTRCHPKKQQESDVRF